MRRRFEASLIQNHTRLVTIEKSISKSTDQFYGFSYKYRAWEERKSIGIFTFQFGWSLDWNTRYVCRSIHIRHSILWNIRKMRLGFIKPIKCIEEDDANEESQHCKITCIFQLSLVDSIWILSQWPRMYWLISASIIGTFDLIVYFWSELCFCELWHKPLEWRNILKGSYLCESNHVYLYLPTLNRIGSR